MFRTVTVKFTVAPGGLVEERGCWKMDGGMESRVNGPTSYQTVSSAVPVTTPAILLICTE